MKTYKILVVLGAMALILAARPANAQFSVVYDFGNKSGDPLNPTYEGIIAQGRDGNLYSTTPNANSSANGTVFDITPSGALSVPSYFTDGNLPDSGLTLGTDGNFYGTTSQGLNSAPGEIFKVTPGGSLTVLHTFTNGDDGGAPWAPPVEGLDGNFYGTTTTGGANGFGTIYKITPAGKLTTLHSFDTSDGRDAWAPVVQGTDGNFYGVAFEGGTTFHGVAYKISPSGKFTLLLNFGDGNDGDGPVGPLVQGSDGNFYGTSAFGGSAGAGSIFKMAPAGKYTVLHELNGTTDGGQPWAGLVLADDGNFYGITEQGGTSTNCFNGGCGTIFEISPKGKFSVLHNFEASDGGYGRVTMIQNTDGILYGDTSLGGSSSLCDLGCGVFFSLNTGLKPFVAFVIASGKVGASVEILGQGFTGTKSVSFDGTSAKFKVSSDTYLTATVPAGATTGLVTVNTSKGALTSNKIFRVTPQILSFNPTSGPVGTVVTIKGVSLTQTTKVTFGGVKATSVTINSDTQVTATVPTGAVTGHIAITTAGGTAVSGGIFTVTQ